MPQVERFFLQSRVLLRHCYRFLATLSSEFFVKFRSFDKVETKCLICFDIVEMTKFHEKLVRHFAKNGNNVEQRSTLSIESFDL